MCLILSKATFFGLWCHWIQPNLAALHVLIGLRLCWSLEKHVALRKVGVLTVGWESKWGRGRCPLLFNTNDTFREKLKPCRLYGVINISSATNEWVLPDILRVNYTIITALKESRDLLSSIYPLQTVWLHSWKQTVRFLCWHLTDIKFCRIIWD